MSGYIVPCLLCFVALFALGRGVDVYGALVQGAREGTRVTFQILPSLVALLTGVAMLRASGALDCLAALLGPLCGLFGIPSEVVPLLFLRPFSGSGGLAIGAELMEEYGPDSTIGRMASIVLGSTETTFYTVAVYFGAAGIRRTRYTIPAAVTADLASFLAAALAVRLFF
jgi:spore maturation protein B